MRTLAEHLYIIAHKTDKCKCGRPAATFALHDDKYIGYCYLCPPKHSAKYCYCRQKISMAGAVVKSFGAGTFWARFCSQNCADKFTKIECLTSELYDLKCNYCDGILEHKHVCKCGYVHCSKKCRDRDFKHGLQCYR